MTWHFKPLPASALAAGACFRRPAQVMLNLLVPMPARVTLDSPAVEALTDFRRVAAVTIDPGAAIDDANRKMIENGIRLLLVVHNPDVVLGIITASDILGEKPMQIVQERGVKHCEIEVRDIMTPLEMLEAMPMRDVLNARVGHVVATLRHSGRQHAMVVEPDDGDSCQAVRGLFSASQIARQLGVPVHVGDLARTFSEIEVSLNHEHAATRALRISRSGLVV
jgi:CBS domain-containing protein